MALSYRNGRAAAEALIDSVVENLGAVDILIANAGTGEIRAWQHVGPDEFEEGLAVNVRAPYLMARRALPLMMEQAWGRVCPYRRWRRSSGPVRAELLGEQGCVAWPYTLFRTGGGQIGSNGQCEPAWKRAVNYGRRIPACTIRFRWCRAGENRRGYIRRATYRMKV